MLIITIIAFIAGIIRYRYWAYWKWALALVPWQVAASILFAGGGTLENPAGDGIITHQIRIATHDGIGMAVFGLTFLVVFWGGVIWFTRRMFLAVKQREGPFPNVPVFRKATEVAVLVIATGAIAYWQYADILARNRSTIGTETEAQEITARGVSPANENAPDPIARQLQELAAEITAKGPQKLDPITTLESVSAQGRTLTYHNRLSRRDASDDALVAFVLKTTLPKVCSNADMRDGIDNYAITYRYSYLFPNSGTPVDVDIDARACAGQ